MSTLDELTVETVEKQKTFSHRSHSRYYYAAQNQDLNQKCKPCPRSET